MASRMLSYLELAEGSVGLNDGILSGKSLSRSPSWKIAELVDVSTIKVQRVRKEHNLGKRQPKILESKRKEIAEFAKENRNLTQKQIAEKFNVHESVVRRACKKYNP